MSRPKVLHIDKNHHLLLEGLESLGYKNVLAYDTPLSILLPKLKEYFGVVIRSRFPINKKFIDKASNLKFIGRLGVGLDNIDTEYCKNENIHVQPATGMNADSVAEYVLSSSLSLIKKIPMFHSGTIKGEWPRTTIKSAEINQKCLGIIGFGTIGKKVAEYSLKNGLNVLAYDPYIKEINDKEINAKLSNLNEIFEKSQLDGKTVIIHSWNKTCATCAEQVKILEKAKKDFKDTVFLSFEQTKDKEIAKFLGIDYWTTIVVYKDNKEISRTIGQTSKEEIYSQIKP